MRIVVDTNVFISGVFFAGLPYQILDAWRCGMVQIVISPPILDEYRRVGAKLASDFPRIELQPWLELLAAEAVVVDLPAISEQVCRDVDDDKFLACAIAGNTKIVVSGDKDLLATSGYAGITVLAPRGFVDRYLTRKT
jgi:putative PIN family toxin of toxin-antitoxin system